MDTPTDSGALFTSTCTFRDVEGEVAAVTVVDGADAGTEAPFADEPLVVGTSSSAGLKLADRGVTRLHCSLGREAGKVRLRDLGSKNGSWVAGCRVEEALLPPGTRIIVGTTILEIRIDRRTTRRAVWQGGDRFGEAIGTSPRMHGLFAQLARVADGSSSILLTGETGTGKEVIARAIHQASARREGPFVVVDCGALAATLPELELFGHLRGAFTDAHVDRAGAFERAHGGTIFLDEIGELPLAVQPKLLRVLEDRTVQRLGDAQRRPVDVRVLAATHRTLARMVNEGTWREDLYYRLAVIELEVPPLRDRAADVPVLARSFLERLAPDDASSAQSLERALGTVAGHRWPGNVRELRSFVQRVVAIGDASVAPARAPAPSTEIRSDLPYADAKKQWVDTFERQYITRLLDETGGNVAEASRRSGLARSRLYELLDAHGLKRK